MQAKKGNNEDNNKQLFKQLEQLYLKLNKDPQLYTDQVTQHIITFQSQFTNLLNDTQRKNQRFGQLVIFLSRCACHYQKSLNFLSDTIMELLINYGSILHPYNRKKAVSCILILRSKNILFPIATTQFLLKLTNLQDKSLRVMIFQYLLNDIRRMNKHHKNQKINQGIQNFIQSYIKQHSDKAAQKCIQLMIELYRRNIWNDNRSVNIIASGCFSQSTKIRLLASYFLLQTTQKLQEIPESSDDEPQIKSKKGIARLTKNRQRTMQKQKKKAVRRLRKKQITSQNHNFMPIDLIYSPQDFCQKFFVILTAKEEKFTHRLIYMALIARLIWRHQLILLPFYGFLVKYMQPHQKDVHRVLAAFAQAVHELIPDDDIQVVIKNIVQKFVNDKCSQFAMTIGLNTIREVAAKVPSILTQQLLLYLCTYYEYKNKNVSFAAKSLINLVRTINPQLLQKKYRGKPQEQQNITIKTQVGRIDGAYLLPHTGDIPIQMDRILTDQDFKMIKKLKRKEQIKMQQQRIQKQQKNSSKKNKQQIQQQQQQQQQEQQDQQQQDQIEQEQSVLQEEEQQCQQEENNQIEIDNEDEQQEKQEDLLEDSSNLDQNEQLDWDHIQQIPQKKQKKVKQIISDSDDSDQQQSQQQDNNPHGFIQLQRIAFYKKSKTQIKAQKKNKPQQKFKHKPKEKKGGSTNRQKQKYKPLLMLRAKKNKIRNRQKQVKIKIKDLKNKLGKIRSGKQAHRKKNKKVKTM